MNEEQTPATGVFKLINLNLIEWMSLESFIYTIFKMLAMLVCATISEANITKASQQVKKE